MLWIDQGRSLVLGTVAASLLFLGACGKSEEEISRSKNHVAKVMEAAEAAATLGPDVGLDHLDGAIALVQACATILAIAPGYSENDCKATAAIAWARSFLETHPDKLDNLEQSQLDQLAAADQETPGQFDPDPYTRNVVDGLDAQLNAHRQEIANSLGGTLAEQKISQLMKLDALGDLLQESLADSEVKAPSEPLRLLSDEQLRSAAAHAKAELAFVTPLLLEASEPNRPGSLTALSEYLERIERAAEEGSDVGFDAGMEQVIDSLDNELWAEKHSKLLTQVDSEIVARLESLARSSASTEEAPDAVVQSLPSSKADSILAVNETLLVSFDADRDLIDALKPRERIEQLRDWLFLAAISYAGIDREALEFAIAPQPAVRLGALKGLVPFAYGQTRWRVLEDGRVLALIPAGLSAEARKDTLGRIADGARRRLGLLPEAVQVYAYRLSPESLDGVLTRQQDVSGDFLFNQDSGYYTTGIIQQQDLQDFMGRIDDLTYVRIEPGAELVLGGRHLFSRPYRNIRIEDVAIIYQSEHEAANRRDEFEKSQSELQAKLESEMEREVDKFNGETERRQNALVKPVDAFNKSWNEKFATLEAIDELVVTLANQKVPTATNEADLCISKSLFPIYLVDLGPIDEQDVIRDCVTSQSLPGIDLLGTKNRIDRYANSLEQRREREWSHLEGSIDTQLAKLEAEREKDWSRLESVTQERIDEFFRNSTVVQVDQKIVNGIGFSLDPAFRIEDLFAYFDQELEEKLRALVGRHPNAPTDHRIDEVKQSLADGQELPLLILTDDIEQLYGGLTSTSLEQVFKLLQQQLSEQQEDASGTLSTAAIEADLDLVAAFGEVLEELSDIRSKFGYQQARYDGLLGGTEVGMILFYTDLLAKLWALDFAQSASGEHVPGFASMIDVRLSPVYRAEIGALPSTRVWFGRRNAAYGQFEAPDKARELFIDRSGTRVYSASSSPLKPGEELAANAQSSEFLDWWDANYEAIAHHEPEYERLNQVMKWSYVVTWIAAMDRSELLSFLDPLAASTRAKENFWFPDWARANQNLTFTDWNAIEFFDPPPTDGLEALPLLISEPFNAFPLEFRSLESSYLQGGVSLANRNDAVNTLKIDKTASIKSGAWANRGENRFEEVDKGVLLDVRRSSEETSIVVRAKDDAAEALRPRNNGSLLPVEEMKQTVSFTPSGQPSKVSLSYGGRPLAQVRLSAGGRKLRMSVEKDLRGTEMAIARILSGDPSQVKYLIDGDPRIIAAIRTDQGLLLKIYGREDAWLRLTEVPDPPRGDDLPPLSDGAFYASDPQFGGRILRGETVSNGDLLEQLGDRQIIRVDLGPENRDFKHMEYVDEIPPEAVVDVRFKPTLDLPTPKDQPLIASVLGAGHGGGGGGGITRGFMGMFGGGSRKPILPLAVEPDVIAKAESEAVYLRRADLPEAWKKNPDYIARAIRTSELPEFRQLVLAKIKRNDLATPLEFKIPEFRVIDRAVVERFMDPKELGGKLTTLKPESAQKFMIHAKQYTEDLEYQAQDIAKSGHHVEVRRVMEEKADRLGLKINTELFAISELVSKIGELENALVAPDPDFYEGQDQSLVDYLERNVSSPELDDLNRANAIALARWIAYVMHREAGTADIGDMTPSMQDQRLHLDYLVTAGEEPASTPEGRVNSFLYVDTQLYPGNLPGQSLSQPDIEHVKEAGRAEILYLPSVYLFAPDMLRLGDGSGLLPASAPVPSSLFDDLFDLDRPWPAEESWIEIVRPLSTAALDAELNAPAR